MNKKRIAAIIGLIGMAVSILCIVVSGIVPALKDLLWTVALITFLVAASISLVFTLRKQEEAAENTPAEKPDAE